MQGHLRKLACTMFSRGVRRCQPFPSHLPNRCRPTGHPGLIECQRPVCCKDAILAMLRQRLWSKLTGFRDLSVLPRLSVHSATPRDQKISAWCVSDGDTFDAALTFIIRFGTKPMCAPRLPWPCANFLGTGILSSEYFRCPQKALGSKFGR